MKSQKPELILPGGDLERVKIAFEYGADAVYVGLDKHSLRKAEIRFGIDEIKEAIDFAHERGKRLFVTFNIFAHNKHLADIEKDMKTIASFNPDAFIMADIGVIQIAKRVAPNVPIHVSTQANTTNIEDVRFWASQGVKRVVLARELTLDEIKEIHEAVPEVELEAFVHGAMCISYSGRCLMSNYFTGRHANLGECAQPCRWNYNVYLEEKLRPGEIYPVEETESGTSIMSSKDLRLVRYLPEMLDAGVIGLKIEGRNKSEYYVATTAHAYRTALELIESKKYNGTSKDKLEIELEKLNYRDYTYGFAFGDAIAGETYPKRSPIRKWDFLGMVVESKDNQHKLAVRNKIEKGAEIEILTPKGLFRDKIINITDDKGNELTEISPGKTGQSVVVELTKSYPEKSMLRKEYIQKES